MTKLSYEELNTLYQVFQFLDNNLFDEDYLCHVDDLPKHLSPCDKEALIARSNPDGFTWVCYRDHPTIIAFSNLIDRLTI